MAAPEEGLLKISEVARQAGVSRSTVQHYLREGLLPDPVKTHRNMAWYPPACVDRIRLIRQLQERRHLPLSKIRESLGGLEAGEIESESFTLARREVLELLETSSLASLPVAEVTEQLGVEAEVLQALEEMDLARPVEVEGQKVYQGGDLEVLLAVAHLRKIGLGTGAGFAAQDLLVYRDAMQALLQEELKLFLKKAAMGGQPDEVAKRAKAAVDGTSMLLIAIRRRAVASLLGGLDF